MASLDDLLDRLSPDRVDSNAVCDELAKLETLPDDEQAEAMFDIRSEGHVLEALLYETHNFSMIVRDLTGEMRIICEDPRDTFAMGPLTSDHLADYRIDEIREGASEGFEDLDADLLAAIVEALPAAGGPVRSF